MIFDAETERRMDLEARHRDGYTHKLVWRETAWYFHSEAEANEEARACGDDALVTELPK